MKTTLRVIALALVALMAIALLASCSKTLSGTYASEAGLGDLAGASVTYKFSGKKVTITVTTTLLGSKTTKDFEGTYEIKTAEDKTETIAFTFEDSEAKEYSGTFAFAEGKNDDGKATITIGLLTYTKQ